MLYERVTLSKVCGRAGRGMDVFRVRDRLIDDYREFTGSFVDIHDKNIREHVAERMARGYQWPDPWLSLNPNFASGGTITDLITEGLLHPECERIFRLKDDNPDGPVLRLHQHQREAIEAARTGSSYVLTTGTGSGKSLAYIIPIVDRVLAAKAAGTYRPGIKAIVVYPMNALANSQLRELQKFLTIGYPEGPPVTFDRYTGQESADDRARIIANPPDILLTNYVMLELVLTRPRDRGLIEAARGLWFLVLDELHTYRGRQGADVALLVRRLRDTCDAAAVQCIGTSATMTTEGDASDQRRAVAEVATTLFGLPVQPGHVIGETLERITDPAAIAPDALRRRISDPHRRKSSRPSPPTRWRPGSRRSSASSLVLRPPARSGAAVRRLSPRRRGSSLSRPARNRRRARQRSRTRCRPGHGSSIPRRAARCSRSGCTSSCPRATTCT